MGHNCYDHLEYDRKRDKLICKRCGREYKDEVVSKYTSRIMGPSFGH